VSEWEILVSVLGTLGGVLVGYWTNSRIESRRRKHEIEMEYRREIMKYMDDIVKPLFHYIEELWGSLATLWESVRMKSSIVKGRTLKDLLLETQTAYQEFQKFRLSKCTEIDLLMPHSLSTWVFAPIEERIVRILTQISEGKEPLPQEITVVINALMKYQKNLKKFIGFETEKKLEDIYPFAQ
jgi:glutamine synthetase